MAAAVARTGTRKTEMVRGCDKQEFAVLPKRWSVDRTIGWIKGSRLLGGNSWWPAAWHTPCRAALFHASSVLAPRPGRGAIAAEPGIVAGAFRASSGLGRITRLIFDWLRAAGVQAVAANITAGLRQTADLPPLVDPGQAGVGPGTPIICVNAPLTGIALLATGRQVASGRRVIGLWSLELGPTAAAAWRQLREEAGLAARLGAAGAAFAATRWNAPAWCDRLAATGAIPRQPAAGGA